MTDDPSAVTAPPTQAQIDVALKAFSVGDVESLGGFENYLYTVAPAQAGSAGTDERLPRAPREILRLTHEHHRSRAALSAELEWLDYAAAAGAPVSRPRTRNGARLVSTGPFTAALFTYAAGNIVEPADWEPGLFRRWGAAMGTLHRLARSFLPQQPRWHWHEDANFNFAARIPAAQTAVLAAGAEVLQSIAKLPTDGEVYGLIHADAHPGNFHVDRDAAGALTFFDFDDIHYNWYAYELASIVFSVTMQPWVPVTQAGRVEEVLRFLPEFLAGYRSEFDLAPATLRTLPLFLRLREHSQYAVIHAYMDVDNIDNPFAARFMLGRRERMAARLPYIDIDFEQFVPG